MPTDKDGVVTITDVEVQEKFGGWVEGAYCGWHVGPGWQEILYTLCKHIEDTLKRYGLEKTDFIVAQVKEKFGGLRFYHEWADMTERTEGIRNRAELAEEDIIAQVRIAEQASVTTCEDCGKPGVLDNSNYWIKCRCPECKAEVRTRRQK